MLLCGSNEGHRDTKGFIEHRFVESAIELAEPALGVGECVAWFLLHLLGKLDGQSFGFGDGIDAVVGEADAQSFAAVDEGGVERSRASGAGADGGEHDWGVDGGGDTQAHDGVTELGVDVGHDDVGGGHEGAAAGDGGAVGGDDDRTRGLADGADGPREAREQFAEHRVVIAAEGEIEAGTEDFADTREHDGPGGHSPVDGAAEVGEHLGREGVALVGAVQADDGDFALGLDLDHEPPTAARLLATMVRANSAAFARASRSTPVS